MREKLVLRLGGQQMKTKTLWGIIWILLILWAGTVLAQTENEAINLAKEASNIYDNAKSKEDYQRAAQKYEEALKIFERVKLDMWTGICSRQLGFIQTILGHYQKSLEYGEKSLAINKKIGDVKGEGRSLNNIGLVYEKLGQYTKALDYHERSLAIRKKIGDVSGEGVSLGNIGLVSMGLGQYTKALDYYEQSLTIMKKTGNAKHECYVLTHIGSVLERLGQYTKALDYYEQSLTISKKIGDVSGEGASLGNLGFVYKKLGQYTKALDYYEQSLAIRKKIGDVSGESDVLWNIGNTYAQMGSYDEALKVANESLVIKTKMGVPIKLIKDSIANYYLDAGNLVKAEPLINETKYDSTLGRLALIKSDYPSAQRYYQKDSAWAEKTGITDLLFRSYTGLARAYEGMKNYPKAEEYYEKAMNQVEEIRSGLQPSERMNFFEVNESGFTRSDPAKGLARVRMKLNRPEESVAPGELTKARAFADHLTQTNATGATNIPPKIIEEEQSLVNSLAAMKTELYTTDREKQPEKYKNLSEAVEEIKTKLSRFVDDLWKSYPAYAAVKYPKPITVKESAVKPEEFMVLFDVSSEGVGVKLVADKNIKKAFYVDWKQKDLEETVKNFRDPLVGLKFRDFDPELAKLLYDKLLRPALDEVPKGAPIIVIPDGILAILPFESLVTKGKASWNKGIAGHPYPEGLTFLADEHPIGYYQSLTALTLVRTLGSKIKPGTKLVVIADPVFQMTDARAQKTGETKITKKEQERSIELMATIEDSSQGTLRFNRLEKTSALADNLGTLYGSDCLALKGLAASKAEFMSKVVPNLDTYGSVVFATHGAMSTKVPGLMEPFLALCMVPVGTDGFLKMSDIVSLKMNTDVVALTACQTALGKDLSGEGVMSMGRAFQYAGSSSVLMTLWEVEESSAVQLAQSFFKYRKEGKSKLDALQAAKKDIRDAGYKHPYFWSGFILVGEVN
jgi:tetratricopeptide (TPR) repeat protein